MSATFTNYTYADGKKIMLRLTAGRAVELENALGASVPQKLGEIEKLAVAAEFVAAALTEGTYPERKEAALGIYDDLIEQGKTYRDYMYLIFDILEKAGFLAGGTVARQKEAYEKQTLLETKLHEAQMQLIDEKLETIDKEQTKDIPSQS